MTEEDLSELSHELLIEMKISKPGHRTKILKKAKTVEEKSTKIIKCDIKLPTITKNSSPSKYRKFMVDWKIYKSEHQIVGSKCNKLLYSACDSALQSSIINGLTNFLETTEEILLNYIKEAATQESNSTVYRLEFQKLDQLDGQNIDEYVDILREKAVDCDFICPMKCKLDYSDFAIRDRFIQGIHNKKLQTNILTNISRLPTLNDVLRHAKSIESANIGVSSMTDNKQENVEDEAGIYAARTSSYKKGTKLQFSNNETTQQEGCCTGCGKQEHMDYISRKEKCPAWGKVCNNCGIRNHFSNVCRNTNDSTALALIAHTVDSDITACNDDLLLTTVIPLFKHGGQGAPVQLQVLPDSGANICLAGDHQLSKMQISAADLFPSNKIISTTGGHSIKAFGYMYIRFIINKKETTQQVFFSHQVTKLYISKLTCIALHLLPASFPHCGTLMTDKRNNNVKEKCKHFDEIAQPNTKEPLIQTPHPDFPFQQIAAEYFTIYGYTYLILADHYSGWFTVSYFKSNEATIANFIKECINLFCAYGAPETFSSGGEPKFKSEEFSSFLQDWNIYHKIRTKNIHYTQPIGRSESAIKTARRIISNYVTKQNPINNKGITRAIIQHRNTPLPDLKLSPAQILFHKQLRKEIPAHPRHFPLHRDWIMEAKQQELLFKTKIDVPTSPYTNVSRNLTPLKPRTKVVLLTGNKNLKWSLSGVVVMVLPFRKYRVKLNGSGRIVTRSRCFLRVNKHEMQSSIVEFSQIRENVSHSGNGNLPIVGDEMIQDMQGNLHPFNKHGFMENTTDIPYKSSSRSDARYE